MDTPLEEDQPEDLVAAVEFEVHTESNEIDQYRQDKLHELLWMKVKLKT